MGAVAGTLTSQDAFQHAVALYSGNNLNPAQFQNPAWVNAALSIIESGQFPQTSSEGIAYGASCSGQGVPNLKLFSTASGLALSTAGATTGILTSTGVVAAGSVSGIALGAATMGASLVIAVIGMIFAHHAAAVQRDQAFACSAWPAVNNAFAVIQQAVQNGQMTAAAASAALPEIYSQAMQAGGASGSISGPSGIPGGGAPINNHPWCNSNCELSVVLLAMVLYWQSKYQAMADVAAANPAASTIESMAASTGLPAWIVYALGGFLLYELVT